MRAIANCRDFQKGMDLDPSKVLAVIPARGGSVGLSRKNILHIAGKPLIAWTIEAALKSENIGRLVVSTDDMEIAQVSRQSGADVIARPEEISGHTASSEDALLHTLAYLAKNEGFRPDVLVLLQCTSPLTLTEDIDGTISLVLKKGADSALAVAPFHYFLWERASDGHVKGVNHDMHIRLPRQQRENQFIETGAVYAMRVEGFLQAKHRFFGKTAVHVTPIERCLEIDDSTDARLAEALLLDRLTGEKRVSLSIPPQGLVLDFDGVFTDNRVLVMDGGREAVFCDRGDGMGLDSLKDRGLPIFVLSKENNGVVASRCKKLGLEFAQGADYKLSTLQSWAKSRSIDLKNLIYLGNDSNDVDCLKAVGCGVVVADAHPSAKAVASIVLEKSGGRGAIREITDLIIRKLDENQVD